MVKKQGDSLQQEEFPLPKYVQETDRKSTRLNSSH